MIKKIHVEAENVVIGRRQYDTLILADKTEIVFHKEDHIESFIGCDAELCYKDGVYTLRPCNFAKEDKE